MAAKGIGACLLACLLAGCAPAPTTTAPTTAPRTVDRSDYVDALRSAGIGGGDRKLIDAGLVACDELRHGTALSSLADQQQAQGWTFEQSVIITDAALRYICPDLDKIDI